MPTPSVPRPRLTLTRRGRLVRTLVILLAIVAVVILVVRVLAGALGTEDTAATPSEPPTKLPSASARSTGASAQPTAELTQRAAKIQHSGIQGAGTWTVASPVDPGPAAGTVHTYAVRVEDGVGLDADAVSREIDSVLSDEKGWTSIEDVSFRQVADPDQADVTISLASPPQVDEMCAPAKTHGTWSCRIGEDVVLNSDRWTLMTPTFDDIELYRAYMINHEVGHFLGKDHVECGGTGQLAPVMLQQSIDLGGCRPNAWPTDDAKV